MKKLFQLFKIQRSASVKKTISNKPLSDERSGIKTEAKAYLTLPMAFDFTAYFDDKELDNEADDNPLENTVIDTNTEVFCMNNEKCTEIHYSSNSRHFECCIT